MPIYCTEKNLIKRANQITLLLSPILPKGKRIAASRYKRGNKREYILGAHVSKTNVRDDYRNWYFKTSNFDFSGNYFEQWYFEEGEKWKMKCAYLNLYYNEQNILCLHCDPDEDINEKHYRYKRGPHLHISDKLGIFSSAHIALNLSNLEQVLNSIEDLESALSTAIVMIKEQFIN